MRLVDVAAGRTRVHLAGDTAKANVGSTAVVATNGTFATTICAPTPQHPQHNKARYQAVLGPLRSLNRTA